MKNKEIILGNRFGTDENVSFLQEDRLRHLHIIGRTGSGKSVLMYNLTKQDIEQGTGLIMIDSYGDWAEKVKKYCEANKKDYYYFAPFEKKGCV